MTMRLVALGLTVLGLTHLPLARQSLPRCSGGSTSPLTRPQVQRAFASFKIALVAEREHPNCQDPRVKTVLATVSEEEYLKHGDIVCSISRTRRYSPKVAAFFLSSIHVYYFDLANVECALQPIGAVSVKRQQHAAVRAVMLRLQGVGLSSK